MKMKNNNFLELILLTLFFVINNTNAQTTSDSKTKQIYINSDGSSFEPKKFYPKFSWETTPQYFMFQDKKRLLKPEEVEFIVPRTDFICIEKSHGKGQLKDAELGAKHEATAFKKAHPDIKVLFYFNSAYAWTYTSYTKNFSKENIDAHPDLKDFLIVNKKTGELAEHYGAYCFDVLNPKFRKWWVKTVAKGVKESNCDGVFIDQMHGNSKFRKEKQPEIEKAMGIMMTKLKEKLGANKILLGNNANNDNAKYAFPACDAIMFENYAKSKSSKESLLKEWKDMLRIAKAGKISVFRLGVEGTGRGNLRPANEMPKLSQEKLEFAQACYLIGAQPYSYFMYSWGWQLSTGPLVDYPAMQQPLGAPKGAYKRVTPDGWEFTREFEHASVWVDTDKREAKITWK